MSKEFMKGAGQYKAPPLPEKVTQEQINQATDKLVNLAKPLAGFLNPAEFLGNVFGHSKSSPGADRLTLDFQPNVLDQFDSFTYHWKLFITTLDDARTGNVLDPAKQTIIVESGVSDLTIDKVELQGIVTPSIEAGTGTQTLIKFEIVEPAGAGLLDKMFFEAVSMGHGNWLVMPVFLELSFKGRVPETQATVKGGSPGALEGLRWVWPIKITDMKAKVSTVGTTYEVSAVKYDELAQSNSYFSIQHNIVLSNLDKFGDAMTALQDKLNVDQYVKLIDNYSIPDVYRVVVDPKLVGIPLTLTDKNKQTMRAGDFLDFNKKTAQFNAGTSIDKIVDILLGNTDYYQTRLRAADTRVSEPKTAENSPTLRPFWRIITETRPIAYDMLRQDNAVEITVFVTEFDLGLVEVDAVQTGQKKDISLKRTKDYLEKGILKKQYNYMFTGLNDQIINLDLNMNFSFAAALSRFGGIYYETAAKDRGPVKNDQAEQERQAAEQVSQTIRFVNDASNSGESSDKRINDTVNSIKNSRIDDNLKQRYINLLSKSKPAERQVFSTDIVNSQGITTTGTLSGRPINGKSLAPNAGDTKLKFISDVNVNGPAAAEALAVYDNARKGKLRPIPFREAAQEINLAGGVDPSSDSARSRTSSVFSTALYSTLDASLQTLKFTIKGDPFWLFPQPMPKEQKSLIRLSSMGNNAFQYIRQMHLTNSVANQLGTDNFILLRFRTPRIYNELSGFTEPYTDVDTFSGVYKVITITSKFEMGKFSQELSCILDPLVDIRDIREFIAAIENEIKNRGKTDTFDGVEIKKPSIKTERIKSENLSKGFSPTTNIPKLPPLGG